MTHRPAVLDRETRLKMRQEGRASGTDRDETRFRSSYMPSLLDRLTDDAPFKQSEHPRAYAPDGAGMLRIIQRDLSLLLNTTNLQDEILDTHYPEAANSVMNYGIPALSGNYDNDRMRVAVEKLIRTAILRYEPRLIPDSVAVRVITGRESSSYNVLRLEISGLMQWSPYPLEFKVQSAYDFELNRMTLESAGK